MTSSDDFFTRRQAAAVLKHGILVDYSVVFAQMTGSRSRGRQVVYLDGYAGPGRYEDGSKGSPLLAAGIAEKLAGSGCELRCIFVERDRRLFADLRANLRQSAPAWQPTLLCGDVEDHLDTVLGQARGLPLLAFFDPFGTGLGFDALVDRVLGRPGAASTEVLLNLSVAAIRRIGGLLGADGRADAGRIKGLARVDRFLGSEWWRQVFLAHRGEGGAPGTAASATNAVVAVVEEYCRKVRARTGFGSFVAPVRRRPDHEPLFLMILFSRHRMGPWKFNEALAKANAEWRAYCQEQDVAEGLTRTRAAQVGGQGSFFDDVELRGMVDVEQRIRSGEQALEASWQDEIVANVRALLRSKGPFVPVEVIAELYGRTLGQAWDKHVNHALRVLERSGEIQARPAGHRPESTRVVPASRPPEGGAATRAG